MSDDRHDLLLEAVEALTKPRRVTTWQPSHEHAWGPCAGYHDERKQVRCTLLDCDLEICGDCGAMRVAGTEDVPASTYDNMVTELHPPLLTMLIEGNGSSSGGKSSDPGIPIDADALELWGQVRDLIRLWCKKLHVPFDDELLGSTVRWYKAHVNAVRSGRVSEVIDHDVTRMVQGWVRMIETKFDPPDIREWTGPCPAYVPIRDELDNITGYRRCGARRVVVGGTERFAISMNFTQESATCCVCGMAWISATWRKDLLYESEEYELELADREAGRQAEMARLANPEKSSEIAV